MYGDGDEYTYDVVLPGDGGAVCPLRVFQTMEADDLCAIFDDAWLGSRVWEATRTLCDQLSGGTEPLPTVVGCTVLELGSGTGVGGIVAAALGATDVVMTDMASPDGTVNLIRQNIEVNRAAIEAATVRSMHSGGNAISHVPAAYRLLRRNTRHGCVRRRSTGLCHRQARGGRNTCRRRASM
jgi:hypothetical protein